MDDVDEIWRQVRGWLGYKVSNLGRVMTVETGYIRLGSINSEGYRTVALSDNGKQWATRVHRLVAAAFPQGEGPQVRHLDGNRLNNVATNLRWGTAKENAADTRKHGTHMRGRQTHCVSGHPLTGANLRINVRGQRVCVICARARTRKQYAKSRGVPLDEVKVRRPRSADPSFA
jgi:hypothetical protein